MTKLLTALFTSALLLSSGAILAADPAGASSDHSTQPNASQTTPGEGQAGDMKEHSVTPPARSAKQNPRDPHAVYSAEVKKCNSLQGAGKQECIAAAKKKAGEM
jgi:hypothetical protein